MPVDDILKSLNRNQQQAVKHAYGPALILAGAGSGKTRVLTYRTAYLMSHHRIPGPEILLCTFTNKAAQEMKLRIQSLLQNTSYGHLPVAGTFHSLCVRILRIDGQTIGIPHDFLIYDDNDQKELIKDIFRNLGISSKQVNPNAVLHTISAAKNELITPTQYAQIAHGFFQEIVASIYPKYQLALRERKAMDFDDILVYTVTLFNESESTRQKYQQRFPYIMVDEYQDTNKVQYELTKLLAGKTANITVVGDAAQSIYRFRGADFRNIANFKSDYPSLKEYHLDDNYRSTQAILDGAYAVISRNTTHPVLALRATRTGGDNITIYEARNEHDEGSYLVQTILQARIPLSQIAVLYRTNAQSRVLEEAFLHAGIPYVLIGGTRFYDRKEIKDVLSYLRLLANPLDSVSQTRIEKLGKGRYKKFVAFQERIVHATTLISLTTLELLDQVLEATDYLSLYDQNDEEQSYRLENIKELRSVAQEFPNVIDFLENVALVESEYEPNTIKAREQGREAVTLMTIHAAKGLEFAMVFMVGMEEGLFPHSRSLMDKEDIEEERRLCYVGMTRAKDRLYISYANRRLFFGTRTSNHPSRFLAEIPEKILTHQVSLDYDRGFNTSDLLL